MAISRRFVQITNKEIKITCAKDTKTIMRLRHGDYRGLVYTRPWTITNPEFWLAAQPWTIRNSPWLRKTTKQNAVQSVY